MRDPREMSVPSRLFRGYGPMACLLASVLAVSLAVPSRVPKQSVSTAAASTDYAVPGQDGATVDASSTTVVDGASTTAAPGSGDGSATVAGTSVARTGPTAGSGAKAGSTSPAGASGAAVTCSGGGRQVAGLDYSPACKPWAAGASNGGATAPGVSGSTIRVSVRMNAFVNTLLDLLADAANATTFKEDPAKTKESLDALVTYFNRTYHFYGRKLEIVPFNGVGSGQDELFGGGAEGAAADATKVQKELQVFADISGTTLPYADQLSRRGVINIGAPYASKQWMAAHAPYAWSAGADCTTIAKSATSYYLNRLAGHGAARAGGALAGKTRTIAVIAPNNDVYKQCAGEAVDVIRGAGRGGDIVLDERYQLDFNDMTNQAAGLAPKIVGSGATTVFCACDPVMLLFLTGKLQAQNYEPEWISTGVAYVDQDMVGQLMESNQWRRAFGVSFSGPTEGLRSSEAYRAFASVAGNRSPSIALEILYYQLQMLAIGVMQAGPNLTPQTFAQGMYEFPASKGRAGAWDFSPGDATTADDAREIFWSPGATSQQNGRRGAWSDPAPGSRYPIGQWPAGEPSLPAP